eukprot:CAMPEP_0203784530 /NCGR_PEP_ID=MMETSP0100_2-20121128/513_1 /ASSEMBLY_ACC=CAM_ASM_000210 /TAXON_ID=96639 /ORGANISM=" , Strain NY0313808BC1" /LENGTH=509 /DNA_ID=CAMNT_0050686513 /DNA_START=32 /DNA_END=1558 /DNA_ORIENTATION=-
MTNQAKDKAARANEQTANRDTKDKTYDVDGVEIDDEGRDCGRWTKEEDVLLKKAVDCIGARNWKRISTEYLAGKRSDVQCLHRWQKVLKPGLVKGPWTKEEDDTIMDAIKSGVTKWSEIATLIPGRIGKQCRERWFNHLDPSIKKGGWSEEEDRILVEYQEKLGNRWCEIAKVLPGRSENAVKNRWNSAMRRKFQQKRKKNSGDSTVAAAAARSTPSAPKAPINHKQRNSIRLPPDAILVEQPTNRNSVIAAREKIKRHQEQLQTLLSEGASADGVLKYESSDLNKKALTGENCRSLSNTHTQNSRSTAQKRPLGSDEGPKKNDPKAKGKKRTKRAGKIPKSVANLLQYKTFQVELEKRKALAKAKILSDDEKKQLHMRAVQFIEDASTNCKPLSASILWAKLGEIIASPNPLDLLPIRINKSKPHLQVQCSLDPSTWTMSGGTPTGFGLQHAATPVGDILGLLQPFSGINPSTIFSPTPRAGQGMTPRFNIPTPIAADIKKNDVHALE